MASVSQSTLQSGRLAYPLSLIIFVASYFVTAKFSLLLATVHVKVTPIWPPTGLALAVCLAFGRRWWPGIFLGALAVNLTTGPVSLSAFTIAIGNTLESLAGAAWIARAVPSDRIFGSVRNLLRFLTFGVLAAPLIGAGVGTLSVMLFEPGTSRPICDLWWTWWLGDASGALVLAPLFLTLAGQSKIEGLSVEQALHTVLTVLTALYAFSGWLHPHTAHYPLIFLTIPTLIWAAFRLGSPGIAATLAINVLIAAASTVNGIGPFSQYPTNASFLLLDAFILIVGGTTYVMSALVTEQKATQSMLRNRGELLEQRIVESTRQLEDERERFESILTNMRDAVWSVSPDGGKVLFVNKVVETIYGYKPGEFYADPELWMNAVHPDDRPLVRAGFAELLRGANFDAVYRIIRLDGEVRWIHDTGYTVADTAGRHTRLDGITRDVTAEKQIEGELRLAQAAFENTAEGAAVLAEALVSTLGEPVRIDEHELFITASIDISIYPDDAKSTEDLIRHADAAMYHAKRLGRNRFQFYSESLTQEILEKVQMETQLRQALKRGELEVYYQPQIDLFEGTVSGAEALVRWHHPEIGLVSPTRFIPLAEESGIICQIGEFVLRDACRQAKIWLDQGLSLKRIAVNVSGQQLLDADLAELVSKALVETGLAPQYLEIEITETVVMQQTEKTLSTLQPRNGSWTCRSVRRAGHLARRDAAVGPSPTRRSNAAGWPARRAIGCVAASPKR